jgi:hypothetical protein
MSYFIIIAVMIKMDSISAIIPYLIIAYLVVIAIRVKVNPLSTIRTYIVVYYSVVLTAIITNAI